MGSCLAPHVQPPADTASRTQTPIIMVGNVDVVVYLGTTCARNFTGPPAQALPWSYLYIINNTGNYSYIYRTYRPFPRQIGNFTPLDSFHTHRFMCLTSAEGGSNCQICPFEKFVPGMQKAVACESVMMNQSRGLRPPSPLPRCIFLL